MTLNRALRGIIEPSINVSEMGCAGQFYESGFRFEVLEHCDRFCAFRVGPDRGIQVESEVVWTRGDRASTFETPMTTS
jgi:hypothetical protein